MTKEEILRKTELFLLDLDGTVYHDEFLIGDMKKTLQTIKRMGKKIVALTNNSSRSEKEYYEKLERLEISDCFDGVMTSGIAALGVVKEMGAGTRVHLLATDGLKEEFAAAGVLLVDEAPDVCLLALDTSVTFEKIKLFNKLLVGGAKFIATHPD
ncbi:MAG: HAD family hydrolase, partial [Clostridiales bacterium]|nr:HAD family hydrolase [Clostridiales bacterium]